MYGLLPFFDDEQTKPRLQAVLDGWLPDDLRQLLSEMRWDTCIETVSCILKSCEPDEKATEEEKDKDWERSEVSLMKVIAEYRVTYDASLKEILDEPWPFFLRQIAVMDYARAMQELSNLGWYAAAKDEKALSRLIRRAGFEKPSIAVPQRTDDKAYMEQQMANAAALASIARQGPYHA